MPKTTRREVVLRAHQLRGLRLTLDEIMDKLEEEFGKDQIPDRSTIGRRLKKSKDTNPPEELAEDAPFAWSSMSDVPWEGSRAILNLWELHLSSGGHQRSGPFTFRLAKWSWRVLQTLDSSEWRGRGILDKGKTYEPYPQDVLDLASEYAWRETAKSILGEPFETKLLDFMLVLQPWKDLPSLLKYQKARNRLGANDYVHWHFYDVAFLDRVAPTAAEAASARAHRVFEGLMKLQYEGPAAVNEVAALNFRRAVDGLLPTQRNQYLQWWDGWETRDKEFPWYIEHIRVAWEMLAAASPGMRDLHDVWKERDNAR